MAHLLFRRKGALRGPLLALWLLAMLVAGLSFAAPARCEEAKMEMPNISGPMLRRLRNVNFHVSVGRIVGSSAVIGAPNGGSSSFMGGVRESFDHSYNPASGITNARYEYSGPQYELLVQVKATNQVSLHYRNKTGETSVSLEQPDKQPLVLTIESGDVKTTVQGNSVWHLFLAAPSAVREYLLPLLQFVNPTWQLAEISAEVENALIHNAKANRKAENRPLWAQLVDDLGSASFAKRQTAERQLLEAGQPVVPFLQGIDQTRLDREQVDRLRSIIDSLAQGYDNTPEAIAIWLMEDQKVWLSLLDREDIDRRKTAADQLSTLIGAKIDFDPAADAPTRKAQIDKLRGRVK